jgi:hypothetical protein
MITICFAEGTTFQGSCCYGKTRNAQLLSITGKDEAIKFSVKRKQTVFEIGKG